MSSYLRPRRGKNATAISQLGANAPLKRGEVFFEVPDAGVGTGLGKIKMGDGSSAYANLPYFLEQLDLDNAKVAFTDSNTADENPYTTNTTLATAIAPTASMKTIFTNLKQLLVNHNAQLTQLNNESAKAIPRMKNWGTFSSLSQVESFLSEHNVSSGQFSGLQVGDYFTLGSYTVYIAGFDTEFNKGDTALTTHHITCIANFGNSKMNNSDITTGGYNGASVMQSFLTSKATEVRNICSTHLLSRKVLLTTAVTNGKSSSWAWQSKDLTLMSETQIYGSIQWGNVYDTSEGYEKLPIFNELTPLQLFGRVDIWLRGVCSATNFCSAHHTGVPDSYGASYSFAAVALFTIG